ncbi:MAG: hypothetical protein ACR2GP_09530 [Burkholderiaceae bacterium]
MNKTFLLLPTLLGAVFATAAVTAQAGELYTPEQYQAPAASPASRGQIKQSVLNGRASGALDHNDVDLPSYSSTAVEKTRAEVKQEVLAARSDGALDHNDVDLPTIAKGSVTTRQEVRNEYFASRKQSTNAPGRNTINY